MSNTVKKPEPNWGNLKNKLIELEKEQLLQLILKSDKTREEAMKFTEGLSKYALELNKAGLTTSQLRNVYANIKIIGKADLTELYLMKIQLAYISARNTERLGKNEGWKKYIINDFFLLLGCLIDVVDESNLDNFKKFLEGIIAYNKYHGGK